MREEAPTIEQARHAYCDGLSGTSRTRAESGAEFDRMIAAVQREAAARALEEVRSTIGAYGWQALWMFEQAVRCIERARAAEIREAALAPVTEEGDKDEDSRNRVA